MFPLSAWQMIDIYCKEWRGIDFPVLFAVRWGMCQSPKMSNCT